MEGEKPPSASTPSWLILQRSSTLWRCPSCRVRYSDTHTHTHTQTHPESCLSPQVSYGPKLLVSRAPSSLYSQLADTAEIQFAREMTEMQSEVEHTHLHLHLLQTLMK